VGNIVFNENIPGQRQFKDLEELARKRAARGDRTLEEARAGTRPKIEVNRGINNRAKIRDGFAWPGLHRQSR
jgi:hypothetical protein